MIWFLVGVAVGAIVGGAAVVAHFRQRGRAILNAMLAHAEEETRRAIYAAAHRGNVRAKHLGKNEASHGAN